MPRHSRHRSASLGTRISKGNQKRRASFGIEPLERRMLLTAVVLVTPAENSHTAPVASDVVVEFDVDVDPTTVDSQTLVVHPAQRGSLAGDIAVSGNTASIDPADDFFAGEFVQVTATGQIQSTAAVATDTRVWQFRAGVTPSEGTFGNSGQLLGNHYSSFVSLGDLDADGDLDAFVTNLGSANRVWLNDGGQFTDTGQTLGNDYSYGVAIGDFDGDGDLDAFVANGGANRVWVNDGNAAFTDNGQELGSHDSNRVSVGDVDGDGDLDAFVANYGQGNRVWMNYGGIFTDSGQILGSHRSFEPVLGDLDGDGDLDAFVANVYQGNRVWLNDGGNFTDSQQILGTEISFAVALGDLDGDGDLDAFVGNSGYEGDTVWLNDEASFTDSGQILADHLTQAVTLGDVDGDGDLDAFAVTGGNYNNHIWINDAGLFTANGQDLFEGAPSLGVALGDLDADGDLDAVIANFTLPNTVWLNEQSLPSVTLAVDQTSISEDGGVAAFTATLSEVAFEPVTITLGFSGTAELDVDYSVSATEIVVPVGSDSAAVTVNSLQDTLGETGESVVVEILTVTNGRVVGVQLQTTTIVDDGDLRLGLLSTTPLPNSHDAPPTGNLVFSFDQPVDSTTATLQNIAVHSSSRGRFVESDGTLTTRVTDLTLDPTDNFFPGETVQVSVTGGLRSTTGNAADSRVWQFRTDVDAGTGTLTDSGQVFGGDRSSGIALGDLDGDGDLDAIASNVLEGNRVLINDAGVFTNSGQSLGDALSLGLSLGDVDGDGDLDAFVANYNVGNRVWRNDGGVFTDTDQQLGNHGSVRATLGDLDGDGDLDAFVTNYAQGNRIWSNEGGTFSDSGQVLGTSNSYGVELGDIDSDGDRDAFISNVGQPNRVWLNQAGEFVDSGQFLGSHYSFGVALGDLDGDGDLDAVTSNLGQGNRVWTNDGGVFSDSDQLLGVDSSANLALGDLDGDGDLDAVVANGAGQANRVWVNTDGTFADSGQNIGASATSGLALGDLDGDGDLDVFTANYGEGNQIWINQDREAALLVTALEATSGGVRIEFSTQFDPLPLNLYDTEIEALGPADFVLQGASIGAVAGSLVVDSARQSVEFVKSGGPLEPDTYTVTLRSGADGFQSAAGELLDGESDGAVGGDFVGTFVVDEPAPDTIVFSVPDFVRGPGQLVNLPADTTNGIPVTISDGEFLRNAAFEFHFDPNLLIVTAVEPGRTLPDGATVDLDTTVPGIATVTVTSPVDLPAGSSTLVHLVAAVPAVDTSSIYGQQQVLAIQGVIATDSADDELPTIGDDGIHLAAFFAEVSGNRRVNANDAAQIAQFAALINSGFTGSLLTDPSFVGDISGNARVNAADASRVARFAALIDVPEIPPIPAGVRAAANLLADPMTVAPAMDAEALHPSLPERATVERVSGDLANDTGRIRLGLGSDRLTPAESSRPLSHRHGNDELFVVIDDLLSVELEAAIEDLLHGS